VSDVSRGPGWWQASDGKWYSPEQQPGYVPAAPSMPSPYVTSDGYTAMTVAQRTNGMAIASLVCSLVAIPLFGIPAILGIIFGFVARSQIRKSNGSQTGDGMALAGIIIGFVFVALGLLLVGILVAIQHAHFTY
jgi:hypothetical protein